MSNHSGFTELPYQKHVFVFFVKKVAQNIFFHSFFLFFKNTVQCVSPRVNTVCARTKAAFQPIIWWPNLDLSWLWPGVKLIQVLPALDAALPQSASLSASVILTVHPGPIIFLQDEHFYSREHVAQLKILTTLLVKVLLWYTEHFLHFYLS